MVHAGVVERAFADQLQRSRNRDEAPSQAGVPGEASGRQRRQGRNPASAAAAADA